jgi:hypothetical protein
LDCIYVEYGEVISFPDMFVLYLFSFLKI